MKKIKRLVTGGRDNVKSAPRMVNQKYLNPKAKHVKDPKEESADTRCRYASHFHTTKPSS